MVHVSIEMFQYQLFVKELGQLGFHGNLLPGHEKFSLLEVLSIVTELGLRGKQGTGSYMNPIKRRLDT